MYSWAGVGLPCCPGHLGLCHSIRVASVVLPRAGARAAILHPGLGLLDHGLLVVGLLAHDSCALGLLELGLRALNLLGLGLLKLNLLELGLFA